MTKMGWLNGDSLVSPLNPPSSKPKYDFSKWTECPKTDLTAKIKRFIAERPDSYGQDDFFHPSQLSSMCPRAELWDRLDLYEPEPEGKKKVKVGNPVLDTGNALHWWYQNHHLADMGIMVADWKCLSCGFVHNDQIAPDKCYSCEKTRKEDGEVRIVMQEQQVWNEEYQVIGHIDGILLRPEAPGGRRIWDKKTINNDRFTGLQGIHDTYIIQMTWYMFCKGIKETEVTYHNKNSSDMRTFLLEYKEDVLIDSKLDIKAALQSIAEAKRQMKVLDGIRERPMGNRTNNSAYVAQINTAYHNKKAEMLRAIKPKRKFCNTIADGQHCKYVEECFGGSK